MASIEKIYGNLEQWIEFNDWCIDNYPDALEYFYPSRRDDLTPDTERTITSFPECVDRWIFANCPIKWVTDRIREQYGDDIDIILESNKVKIYTLRMYTAYDAMYHTAKWIQRHADTKKVIKINCVLKLDDVFTTDIHYKEIK